MKKENKSTITSQVRINVHDHCTSCPWLNKQPEGNKMLCILPGECFWLKSWTSSEVRDHDEPQG